MDSNSSAENPNLSSSATHRRVQKSTTLNRRYVKRPEATPAVESVAKRRADDLRRRQALAEQINRERLSALKAGHVLTPQAAQPQATGQVPVQFSQSAAQQSPTARSAQPAFTPSSKPLSATIERSLAGSAKDPRSSKQIKDSALQNALKAAQTVDREQKSQNIVSSSSISTKNTFGAKKILLAFGCAALAVGVISYFVSTSTPDLSVRVAAMQSGIDAAYPSYIPRGYTLSDIVSEEGKLELTFTNSDNTSFSLKEEKSAWDNHTLESNYAKETWGDDYTSVREQGITIYISGSDAAWVNGGIMYRLDASGNNLTKKQIKSIVTSI